jgi:O-antigen/teichoic acid export membrane protein
MSSPERSSRALARGGAAGVATLAVERGAALLLVAFLARWLGADEYGRVSFVVAYLSVFQILADLGLEPVLLRRLSVGAADRGPEEIAPSRDRETHARADEPDRGALLAAALGLRLALAFAAGLVAVAVVPWIAGRVDLAVLVAAAAPAFLWASQPGLRALFRAEGRLGEVLRVATTGALATLVFAGGAVLAGGGATAVLLAMAAAQLFSFGIAALRSRGSFRLRLSLAPETWRSLLRESWPIGANLVVAVAGLRIAPILLMRYRGAVDVGAFASAARLAESLNLVADGAMLAVFPVLARLGAARPRELAELAALAARWLALGFLCIALFLSQVSEDVVTLVFGPKLAVAGPVLAVLGWNAVLSALGTLYANLLVVVGRQRLLLALNAVSAVAQLAVQIPLISRFGLAGAAIGVLGQAVVNHVVLRFLPESGEEIRACFRAVIVPALAAVLLLAVAPVLPLGPWGRAFALPAALAAPFLVARVAPDRAALRRLLTGSAAPSS